MYKRGGGQEYAVSGFRNPSLSLSSTPCLHAPYSTLPRSTLLFIPPPTLTHNVIIPFPVQPNAYHARMPLHACAYANPNMVPFMRIITLCDVTQCKSKPRALVWCAKSLAPCGHDADCSWGWGLGWDKGGGAGLGSRGNDLAGLLRWLSSSWRERS